MPVTNLKSRWVSGALDFYDPATGASVLLVDGPTLTVTVGATATFALASGATFNPTDLGLVSYVDNQTVAFGTGTDVTIGWDGTDLDILAAADDSVIKIGNGTNSFDVWLYGNTVNDYLLWDASAKTLTLTGGINLVLATTTGTKIGTGTTQLLGFYNTTPVDQPAALTAQLTTITPADAEGTPDYAIAAITQTTPYGFASAQEAITCLYVVKNLQVRLAEVEARLEELGLVAAN